MSGFQQPITIYSAMRNIEEKCYLLPAFQREFVWSSEQIERLFDSLMQGYPISSMLFWKVKVETVTDFNFYLFLDDYIERYKTHNDRHTSISKDFIAVLDGQQRLTALHIGLYGSYAYHAYHKSWDNTPNSFPERKLYLCITKMNSEEDVDKKYLFSFLKTSDTNSADLHKETDGELWFRVGKIIDLHLSRSYDLDDFCDDNDISKTSKKMLRALENQIFTEFNINYYEEDEQNPDKAVSIFTRINSGGTYLSISDIMFSLLVANWKKDAKYEINWLKESVANKGFNIDTSFILKTMLFLYHKQVRFLINSFSKSFCKSIEDNWEKIRDTIETAFDLMRVYGLSEQTLTSKNAVLPIIYYLFHSNKYIQFTTAVRYCDERNRIKNWLYSVLLRRAFGNQSDGILTSARKAFTDDIESSFINVLNFPATEINEHIKRNLDAVDDEYINELLATQKDNKYSFAILSLLFPDMDYKNNNFHKDHLHPEAHYKKLSAEMKALHPFADYNSIINLQMLDANENESKSDKTLKQWVDDELQSGCNRESFLKSHLIPDVDLSLENFDEFYRKRKELLADKLKKLLQV
ncbi:MAG: DUF262 domain-containing protein [Spirochaetes bacterium]|uniref:DUF262 domain-containing protein n=1 Tax=Candidatus Ornithospirochaeta stercoripullorum TaxID=2840899 RepID=A0A9D9E088_9SPIO|nr:DUF262 domain-containing protein [Candidatus Ornithospirochaeta stercoripullorum]